MTTRIHAMRTVPLLGLLAACAPFPAEIEADVTRSSRFDGLSCGALLSAEQQTAANLETLSDSQREAATMDAVTVALIGIPFNGVTGHGHEEEIAQSKGELRDLHDAMNDAGCV